MATGNSTVQFSQDGNYLAFSSVDGVLRFWETATGNFLQEYTPSAHLTATCTCLTWAPQRLRKTRNAVYSGSKKKRKNVETVEELVNADYVAIGTATGDIQIYSLSKNCVVCHLKDGHQGTVNGISWSDNGNYIFSCSNDKQVIQWDVLAQKIVQKWLLSGSIHSITLLAPNVFATGSRAVEIKNISDQSVIKFSGHPNDVTHLHSVSASESTYLISSALDDHHVLVWCIGNAKKPVCSFVLPDDLVHLSVLSTPKDNIVWLSGVTRSGVCVLFKQTFNGHIKKPISQHKLVTVTTEGSEDEIPKPLEICGTHLMPDHLLLVHGTFAHPVFEKVDYQKAEESTVLVRKDPTKSVIANVTSASKVRTAVQNDVKILVGSNMAPSGPIRDEIGKRRRKISTGDATLGQRIDAIDISEPDAPKIDSLVILLSQGLKGSDRKIIASVLSNTSQDIIRNTVARLPVMLIEPLLDEITKRLPTGGKGMIKWLKTILNVHASYLMSVPQVFDQFSNILQVMNNRVDAFQRLTKLHGRLDLMLSQVTAQAADDEDISDFPPVQIYNDESSDEDNLLAKRDYLVADDSEFESGWEEDDTDKEVEMASASDSN